MSKFDAIHAPLLLIGAGLVLLGYDFGWFFVGFGGTDLILQSVRALFRG